MVSIKLLKGDDYLARRPVWVFSFVNDANNPYDLAACKVRTTYKTEVSSIEDDPADATAIIRHFINFSAGGTITASEGLVLGTTAQAGVIKEYFTAAETRQLPASIPLLGEIRLVDANGETYTFPFLDTITAVDTLTNRLTDVG